MIKFHVNLQGCCFWCFIHPRRCRISAHQSYVPILLSFFLSQVKHIVPSWELIYPVKSQLWRWFSFSFAGTCWFPGGYIALILLRKEPSLDIYLEPVNVLYFGLWILQKKAQTPFKTWVIWVPGSWTYVILDLCVLFSSMSHFWQPVFLSRN